jgi:hypothetical protein
LGAVAAIAANADGTTISAVAAITARPGHGSARGAVSAVSAATRPVGHRDTVGSVRAGAAARTADARRAPCSATARVTSITAGTTITAIRRVGVTGRTGTAISWGSGGATHAARTAVAIDTGVVEHQKAPAVAGVSAHPTGPAGRPTAAVAARAAVTAGLDRICPGLPVAAVSAGAACSADASCAARAGDRAAVAAVSARAALAAAGAVGARSTGLGRARTRNAGPACTASAAGAAVSDQRHCAHVPAVAAVAADARLKGCCCSGATITATAGEQPTGAAVASSSVIDADDPGTTVAATAVPAGRAAIAAVVAVAAIAEHPAVTAGATASARAGFGGPGVAVSEQDPAIGMFGSPVTEQPDSAGAGRGT